jgi:hypothetical protein
MGECECSASNRPLVHIIPPVFSGPQHQDLFSRIPSDVENIWVTSNYSMKARNMIIGRDGHDGMEVQPDCPLGLHEVRA